MKRRLAAFAFALAAGCGAMPACAADGFYGGITRRDSAGPGEGLSLSDAGLAWGRFAPPVTEEPGPQSLVFGGYRFRSDVSIEAALNSADRYALRPPSTVPGGVGLGLSSIYQRTWNADVFTSWEFVRSVSLYGRLGYAQNDVRSFVTTNAIDPRFRREGVNYGVGLRYDMTHALGLRVEYARFGRFAGDYIGSGLPDGDQLSVGVQFRF